MGKKKHIGHPIGVVARRTGVAAELLRAWERRYQAVTPIRTDTGRRLYSDEDIERLRLIKSLIEGRRRVSDVAGLALAELQELQGEDQRETVPTPVRPVEFPRLSGDLGNFLEQCHTAVAELDALGLERVLLEASRRYSPEQVRRDLLVPLMVGVGERWHGGELRMMHEHMATAIVRSFLITAASHQQVDPSAPVLVATTPAGQHHEIGILIAVAAAQECGWRPLYLGPNMPAEEIAGALHTARSDTLVLSLVYPLADLRVAEELRRIRHLVGPGVDLLVGGRAAHSYCDAITEIDGALVEDLNQLREHLGQSDVA